MRTQKLMVLLVGLVFSGVSLRVQAAVNLGETSREVVVAEISSLEQVRFSCKPGVAFDRPYPTHSRLSLSLIGLISASNVQNVGSLGPSFVSAPLGDHCAELTAALEKQLPAQAVITQVFSEGCDIVQGRNTQIFFESVTLVIGDTTFSESKRSFGGKCPR